MQENTPFIEIIEITFNQYALFSESICDYRKAFNNMLGEKNHPSKGYAQEKELVLFHSNLAATKLTQILYYVASHHLFIL